MRTKPDAMLSMPRLIIPSIQVNMKAGEPPAPDEHGKRYLKTSLNLL